MLSLEEIHIGRLPGGRQKSDRLYYYQGNFFHPMELRGAQVGLVKRKIREFMKANAKLVAADRADPEYKTILQLFDEQVPTS